MSEYKRKAKYTRSLEFLKNGYLTIKESVFQLIDSSNLLLEAGAYGQSTAIAIIALEECGKIYILDSLLYSKPDGEYNKNFKKDSTDHKHKLDAIQFFIPFLELLSEHDKRKNEKNFRLAIGTGLSNMHRSYKELRDDLPDQNIHELNNIKQAGFYTRVVGESFLSTKKAVGAKEAIIINKFANVTLGNMKLIMTPQNISAYLDNAQHIRSIVSLGDWDAVAERVNYIVKTEFVDFKPKHTEH
jgi:AbiV family abortive infection protein